MTGATVANTAVTVGSIHIPTGTWLVLAYADLALSANGTYVFALGSRSIRHPESNGGGAVGFYVTDGERDVNISAYTSTNNTIRISYTLVRLA